MVFGFYSSAWYSLSPFCPDRNWGSGWFWPVSPSAACCRTTRGPPPSPGGGLWRCKLFPATTACFSPQSCAPAPPWLQGCKGKDTMNMVHVHTRVLPHYNTTLYLMVVRRFLFRSFMPILSLYKAAGGRERFEVAEGSLQVCRQQWHHRMKSQVLSWMSDR